MHEQKKKPPKKRRQRRWWVRSALQDRESLGHANKLLPLLRDRDVEYYREYLRMPPRSFDTLLHLVRSHIKRKDTNFLKAISPEHRLAQNDRAAYKMRDLLAKHFITNDTVPWQEHMIKDRTLYSGAAPSGDANGAAGSSVDKAS
ncbi:hypothetical protein HPB50_029095 [Hyalomma asiaticum]|nr:hypothetical protein HPB50_029095 [Hyalomma asiaticum]